MNNSIWKVLGVHIFVFSILFLSGCEEAGISELKDYPFETLQGYWVRNGNVGGMGITYLGVDEDVNDEDKNPMLWRVLGSDLLFDYTWEKTGISSYSIKWYAWDMEADPITPPGEGAEVDMNLTLAFDDEDNFYLATDAEGMGGLTMTRVSDSWDYESWVDD